MNEERWDWDDRDVCYHCFAMGRPHLFPYGSLKLWEWVDPYGNEGEFCGHRIEMLCEDCAVVNWAWPLGGVVE